MWFYALASDTDPTGEGFPVVQPSIPPPQCSALRPDGFWLYFFLSLALLHRLTITNTHFHLSRTFQLEVKVVYPYELSIATQQLDMQGVHRDHPVSTLL